MPDSPLLLHWDIVDCVAIFATGGDVEQLLAVPKIGRGTGEEQCYECLHTLADWKIKNLVHGLVSQPQKLDCRWGLAH